MDRDPNFASLSAYGGLDLLSTAVLVVDGEMRLCHANIAAEDLFGFSKRNFIGVGLDRLLPGSAALLAMIRQALASHTGYNENDLTIELTGASKLHVSCYVTPADHADLALLEFRAQDQQLRIAREEALLELQQLNRELMRNLAHEIKNPLGGIRGAAQLLERELPNQELAEYTQVIVQEADRLQKLMDRLLTPNRLPQIGPLNVHEVLERVRTLVLAEFPATLVVKRDYDVSLPVLSGDKEQLIQAMLNIVGNAAQALEGKGEIRLVTRIARNVTLARHRYRQAIQIDVIDNGPGIPEELKSKIFYPLVSGREGGSGLGLPLAQSFVHQHAGIIEFECQPGVTRFSVVLPLMESAITATAGQGAN